MAGEEDDEDLIITIDSLDDPIDTTLDQPARREGPVRLKVPGRDDGGARVTPARTTPTDDAVEDLRGQLSAANQRTADAQRRARESDEAARTANARVDEARGVAADTYGSAIESEITSATTESTSLQSALQGAYEAGNFKEAAELQVKIADARARLNDATKEKNRLAQEAPIRRTHEGAVREQPRQDQPVRRQMSKEEAREHMLSGCTPKTRAWLEAHPDCIDNPVRAAKAGVVHAEAIEQGLEVDSPEYFRFANEQLGYTKVTKTRTEGEPTNGARGRVVQSAPVDRGGSGGGDGGGGGGGQSVSLTREEARMATDGTMIWNTGANKGKPIGTKEMARRKLLIQKGEAGNLRYVNE